MKTYNDYKKLIEKCNNDLEIVEKKNIIFYAKRFSKNRIIEDFENELKRNKIFYIYSIIYFINNKLFKRNNSS